MSAELVARLRGSITASGGIDVSTDTLRDAAAEIERLTAALGAAERERDELREAKHELGLSMGRRIDIQTARAEAAEARCAARRRVVEAARIVCDNMREGVYRGSWKSVVELRTYLAALAEETP